MVFLADGGHENDRYVLHGGPRFHQAGGLETIHHRHLDIKQDDGEVLLQHQVQRLLARIDRGDGGTQRFQQGFGGEQVFPAIIDNEYFWPGRAKAVLGVTAKAVHCAHKVSHLAAPHPGFAAAPRRLCRRNLAVKSQFVLPVRRTVRRYPPGWFPGRPAPGH